MKRVVSVSLGTSKRDKVSEIELLGERFRIERRGTDGDRAAFRRLMEELDGQVDALGIGGADRWVVAGDRRYAFREVEGLISGVKKTPVVDGSGLKHTLEREAIRRLHESGRVDFATGRVLLVSAVDRYGMAEELARLCPNVVYGDLCFGLGLPIPVRRHETVIRLGRLLLPIVTRLPIQWFYPTGEKQEQRKPAHPQLFREATLICGDWHYIRRAMPDDMAGKRILTQTIRRADLDLLRSAGVREVFATTPEIGGETFATNVMEGVLVALAGRPNPSPDEFLEMLGRLGWEPQSLSLEPESRNPAASNGVGLAE